MHAIPGDGRVNGASHVVTRKDGATYQLAPCAYLAFPNWPRARHAGRRLIPPTDTGWIEYADEYSGSGTSYRQLQEAWHVPQNPDGAYSGSKVYYTFPGLDNATYINQPVIQYGYNGAFGSTTGWVAASWHCNDGSSCSHSASATITSADSMSGVVSSSACSGGTCTWTITTLDVTKDRRVVLTVDADDDNYRYADGGVIEAHGAFNSCRDFPPYGTKFTDISLSDQSGAVTPSWSTHVPSSPDPDCDFDVLTTSTTVRTAVNGLIIELDGPTNVDSGDVNHWSGFIYKNGIPSYTWWWTGILTGSGSSIYGDPANSGELVVHAADQFPDTASDSIYVYVCDPAPAICPYTAAPHTARVYRRPPLPVPVGASGER